MPRNLREWWVRPLKFLTCGVANTILGLAVIFLCRYGLGTGDVTANAIGYGCGLMLSFLLNARWTFRFEGLLLPAALRFGLSFLIAYAANLAAVLVLLEAVGLPSYLAQVGGVPFYVGTFYLLASGFVFRSSGLPSRRGA